MSNHTSLPAGQRSRIGASLHEVLHPDYLNGDSSGSQETSAPPPSYTVSDTFSQIDPDVKSRPPEVQADVALADSPAQLPFDDLIGSSSRQLSLPVTPHHQDSLESQMAIIRLENQRSTSQKVEAHSSPQTLQQQSADLQHPRQRSELPQAPRSISDTRKALRNISELEEVDPYGNKFHEESPFEAARRAQREADRDGPKASSPSGQTYANGRFPSIKPGEIMPSKLLRLINGPPSFFPPLEAPPFPPTVHAPIRPAHFPPNLHPPTSASEPARTPSQPQPPSQHTTQIPQSHSYHKPPSPSQPISPVPPNPAAAHLDRQLPREVLRSHSQPVVPHSFPPQFTRSHTYQTAPPPNTSQYQEHSSTLPPSRRHTLNALGGAPPGLTPNGPHPVAQRPPPVPYVPPPQHHHPSGSPSRSQSQHHPPAPPSRSPSQYHHPTPQRSALRDQHRQSLQPPSSSQLLFAPRSSPPVRLPSQNVPTPQALGIVRSPPTPSGSLRLDNSRPPRATPKPVMPQLLAPLVTQEPNLTRGGASQLQRSMSVAAVQGEKGGFLAKTKSILRKRSSATGIKTHTDGAISFAPTMTNLMEENAVESGKLGKRLNRKK